MVSMVKTLPKFSAGEVIHLSHTSGLPMNAYIGLVYTKPWSTEWMYGIRTEAVDNITYVPESVLIKRVTRRKSPVYERPFIINMDKSGFRFAGNYCGITDAESAGAELAKNPAIRNVVIHNAWDSKGLQLSGYYGVWIKWENEIASDYMADIPEQNGSTTPIRIK